MAIKNANTKKAPGAITKIPIPSQLGMLIPRIVPAPKIYLKPPKIESAIVNPSPIPTPSKIDGITGFFDA